MWRGVFWFDFLLNLGVCLGLGGFVILSLLQKGEKSINGGFDFGVAGVLLNLGTLVFCGGIFVFWAEFGGLCHFERSEKSIL